MLNLPQLRVNRMGKSKVTRPQPLRAFLDRPDDKHGDSRMKKPAQTEEALRSTLLNKVCCHIMQHTRRKTKLPLETDKKRKKAV